MKQTILILSFLALISSCSNNKPNSEPTIELIETKQKITPLKPAEHYSIDLKIWDKVSDKQNWFLEKTKQFDHIDSIPIDFVEFYEKFISDSAYQFQHVKFPILGVIGECDTTILLNSKNWEYLNWDFRPEFNDENYSNITAYNDSLFYYRITLDEIGQLSQLGFKKLHNEWYLIFCDFNAC